MKIHIASLRNIGYSASDDGRSYSHEASRCLAGAFTYLDTDPTVFDHLLQIFSAVMKQLQRNVSLRQRMQLFTVLGETCWKLNACALAVECYEEALSLSETLGDWGARAELAFRRGLADSVLFNYSTAADYFEISLDSLCAFLDRSASNMHALALEAEVHAALAVSKFVQQEYDAASQSVERCRTLARLLPKSPLLRMRAERIDALVWRWRGQPLRALKHMSLASQQFADIPNEPSIKKSYGRLQQEFAEILLDVAAVTLPVAVNASPTPNYLEEAASHILVADRCARQTADSIGGDLVLLSRARQERAAGLQTDRLSQIKGVIKRAKFSGDVAVHVQAYTSMAQELYARDEREEALNCHRAAIDVIGRREIPGLAKWSQNALIAASVE